jgi:uncharacterized membrane protein YsdA (DUF1294 family)
MPTVQIILLILIYIVAINLVAIMMFVVDKSAAQRGSRRISESTLLTIALVGGSIGSITAQQLIRHKTYKQPFKGQLYSIAVLHVVILTAICFPDVREIVFSALTEVLAAR